MDSGRLIAEGLISSRNILLNGHSNDHVLTSLDDVLSALNSVTVESTRNIFDLCIREVISQIKKSDFNSAGLILNLVHNLPLNEVDEKDWNVDYFLSMELSTFLEHYEEIQSSRMIVLHVCDQLATKFIRQ